MKRGITVRIVIFDKVQAFNISTEFYTLYSVLSPAFC